MTTTSTHRSGFTLVEIIVVIGVLTLLAGVIVPMFTNVSKEGRIAQILSTCDAVKKACIKHYQDSGKVAVEYSGASYTAAKHHKLAMKQTYQGWRGPYLERPLSLGDNPFGGTVHLYAKLNAGNHAGTGFDLVGGGTDTVTGAGNFLYFSGIPEDVAEAVDQALDKSLPGTWTVAGRVEYKAAKKVLCVFLLDA